MPIFTRLSNAPSRPSVLIVNGNPDICSGFTNRLTAKGYDAESVLDGKTCFERIQHKAFSVLLLHDRLPDQDGLSLLTAIRFLQPTLPVIITTAAGPSPVALQRGAFAVLLLPYLADELDDLVQRAISPTAANDSQREKSESPLNKTVLLIGLKPELNSALSELLRSKGYDPELVDTVEQALAILPQRQINVGIGALGRTPDLLTALRHKLLVIMFTENESLDAEQSAFLYRQGAFAVIDRPYSHNAIFAVLAQATCKQPFEMPLMVRGTVTDRAEGGHSLFQHGQCEVAKIQMEIRCRDRTRMVTTHHCGNNYRGRSGCTRCHGCQVSFLGQRMARPCTRCIRLGMLSRLPWRRF